MSWKQRTLVCATVFVMLLPAGMADQGNSNGTSKRLDDLEQRVGGLEGHVDSFFDVFFEIDEQIGAIETEMVALQLQGAHQQGQIDSFFDVFVDLGSEQAALRDQVANLQGQVASLQRTVDSFFDVFTERTAPKAAAVDYFLKIEGVEGESVAPGHEKEIDVLSWSWGETNAGSSAGSGGGAGKVSMQDFSFVMQYNKASPKLFLACATGQHLQSATLSARKAGGEQQEYLIIKFTDVMITSYQTAGSSEDPVPTESVSLNFAKIEFEYKPQRPDGSLGPPVRAGYDVAASRPV